MEHVVLVIHLMLALAIICLVLLQRSEGGGLGIGGSGGLGNLATPGGAASAATRATGILAACFFATSLILGILAGNHGNAKSLLDEIGKTDSAAIVKTTDVLPAPATESPSEKPSVPLE